MIDLSDKYLLVTGASRGIGRGCAIEAARLGANVAINYRSHADEAEDVADVIRDMGREAMIVQADIADPAAVDAMFDKVIETCGRLDLFVSNAAYSDRQLMAEADLDGFRRTIDVCMWGAFYGMRRAALQMIKQGKGGSIVIVSSPHADKPIPTAMAYNMAKAAIDHMARTAAIELSRYRIRVNIMHPGWIDTPGERKFFTEEQLEAGAQNIPWKRLGTPEEIGRAVGFMLSDAADYMTGSTLLMDGGISLPWWSKREEGGQ